MSKVVELFYRALVNREENTILSTILSKAQFRQYEELITAGANDEDDFDEALVKYPSCKLKF